MLIELPKIVYGICDEAGDPGHKYFMKYLRYANLAYKDLTLYVLPHSEELNVKSSIEPLGDNFMVQLPDDVVDIIKVGICSNGRIVHLATSDDLCGVDTNNQNCPCEETTTEINNICCGTYGAGLEAYTYYNVWRNGQQIGELYGATGGNYCAYVKYDRSSNRLILSSELEGEVIVEYKSDGVGEGVALVPTECDIAIRSFCHWRDNVNARPRVAQMHREDYYTEYNRLKKFYSSYTAKEWRDVFLQATTSTVKR